MINFRHEDLPPAAEMVVASFRRDINAFSSVNSKYTQAYIEALEKAIEDVRQSDRRQATVETQKALTSTLGNTGKALSGKAQLLRIYIKAADKSTANISSLVRSAAVKNIESATKQARELLAYAEQIKQELVAAGMPTAFLDEFRQITLKADTQNAEQNNYILQARQQTVDKIKLHNILEQMISEICAIGKVIFSTDKVKRNDYTMAYIKKMLRSPKA